MNIRSLLVTSKVPGPYKPFKDVQRSVEYKPSDTHDRNLKKWEKKRLEALDSIEKIIKSVLTLPHTYDQRKQKQLQGFRFFVAPSISKDRPEALAFITSIAQSLTTHNRSPKNLTSLKAETRHLEARLIAVESIVTGAYLLVLNRIESDYKAAWLSKSPKSSQLYQELSERLGELTEDKQKVCLEALHDHLTNRDAEANIKFGSLTKEATLKRIDESIEQLSASVSLKK
ncbi:hypothetical protein [Legionella impletisoli]|uniref:Uncharacterized protein n=1 Tax=Legionella impletisoli TaxID=343510 RepID=A0A917JNL5_9GAMM|nr:hypothetical protein [Legionella impletisoli]GGI75568.1 hypothetical protein GCM10007966_00460 [Legionella impletisoli]